MGPAHQLQLNLDNRQALVLFSIVFIFFVSNVPRIFLNLHEVWLKLDYIHVRFTLILYLCVCTLSSYRSSLLVAIKRILLAVATIYLYGYMWLEIYPNFWCCSIHLSISSYMHLWTLYLEKYWQKMSHITLTKFARHPISRCCNVMVRK